MKQCTVDVEESIVITIPVITTMYKSVKRLLSQYSQKQESANGIHHQEISIIVTFFGVERYFVISLYSVLDYNRYEIYSFATL